MDEWVVSRAPKSPAPTGRGVMTKSHQGARLGCLRRPAAKAPAAVQRAIERLGVIFLAEKHRTGAGFRLPKGFLDTFPPERPIAAKAPKKAKGPTSGGRRTPSAGSSVSLGKDVALKVFPGLQSLRRPSDQLPFPCCVLCRRTSRERSGIAAFQREPRGIGERQEKAHFSGDRSSQDADTIGKGMVPRAGIEPATRGFSIRCSTN